MSKAFDSTASKVSDAVLAMLRDPKGIGEEQLAGGGAIARVEEKLCAWYGVEHCLLVNNATNGLFALALVADLTESEIIVPPQSYGATYGPLKFLNNRLIVSQSDVQGNMSVDSVAELISPATKAVWATDLDGQPHDTAALKRVCAEHRIKYFSDAASSLGRMKDGSPASSCADAWVVSLGPNKSLFCGEGGAILTNDATLYERLVWLTQHPHRYRREFSLCGHLEEQFLNARIHPLAAILAEALLPNVLGEYER